MIYFLKLKMDDGWLIYNKDRMTYIHSNPFSKIYFESKDLIGALGMTKESATKFIVNELDKGSNFKIESAKKEVFDKTH